MDPSVAQAAAFAAQFHQPPPQQPPQQPPYSADFYSTSVANPNHQINISQPIPSHPSYAEMITAAISWENSQGKESGSSKRAIAKYIDRVYTNLPPTHSALLTHHLKRLKAAGQLVMVKNSYQLPSLVTNLPRSVEPQQPPYVAPSVVDQSVTVTPKRKPGRPPKLQTPESVPVIVPEPVSVSGPGLDQVVVNGSSLGKRRRGRPAKEKSNAVEVVVPFVAPVNDVAVVSNGQVAKRRGRPARAKEVVNGGVAVAPGVGRGRGRPKSIGMKVGGSNMLAAVAVEKKKGWPKGKKRGKRVVNGSVLARGVGVSAGGVVKRRGRKPKGLGVGVGVGVGMGGVMKRRGRKPKGFGVVNVGQVEKKVYNGKPRGRPKKNSVLVKHTSEQGQETANKDLLKKLEDMQLKIRGAVEVLRPHLANQTEPNALTALQQLEELSTMNLTASTALIESPLMTTVPLDMVAPPESTSEPDTVVPAAPSMAFDAAPEMSMPSPFSTSVPGIENQQPMSWIQS